MNSIVERFFSPVEAADGLCISRGTVADFDSLARFHYRPARPGACVLILTMREPGCGEPIGVLTVSMPTLNGRWRAGAFGPEFGALDKRRRAAHINGGLRTISRIIIEPRWRGLGLAQRLVRAYLDRPLTQCTEAVAAMGTTSPLFVRAGMTACLIPPSRHDVELLRALREAGVRPWQLLDARVQRRMAHTRLARRLRTWGRSSRAHRAWAEGPLPALALRAATALSAPRTAYIWRAPASAVAVKHTSIPPQPQAPTTSGACAPACRGSLHGERQGQREP